MPVDATSASRGFSPAYLTLFESGELKSRVDRAVKILRCCTGCPRNCRVDRLQNEFAVCRTGRYAVVASHSPHHGEEDCLRGWRGSGTIFFSGCNLRCVFCQNFDISWQLRGTAAPPERLAAMMLELQDHDGLLIRHLVMPQDIAGTRQVMNWIAQELSPTTYVNLMSQYYPAGKVTGQEYAEIGRRVTPAEYEQALDDARREGLRCLHP